MELNISASWVPVVSGLVGALGAVVAQGVAAIATARRETKASEARRAEARAAAFMNEKRELYVRVLAAVDDTLADYDELLKSFARGTAAISIPTGILDHERWKGWAADFDLLAPDVAKAVNACRRSLFEFDMSVVFASHDEKALSDQEKEVRVKRAELRDAMRVSLGVAEPTSTARTPSFSPESNLERFKSWVLAGGIALGLAGWGLLRYLGARLDDTWLPYAAATIPAAVTTFFVVGTYLAPHTEQTAASRLLRGLSLRRDQAREDLDALGAEARRWALFSGLFAGFVLPGFLIDPYLEETSVDGRWTGVGALIGIAVALILALLADRMSPESATTGAPKN